MSASAHDAGSSESSSGYEDGLGRRVLAIDRESGEMRERLRLRPELTAFVRALEDRLPIVAALEEERIARPRALESEPDGRLTVVSDYVTGRRLSDILDDAAEHGIVAGLDAGLGLLLEILPALSRLHDAGLTHGALAPGRVVITPDGQVVLVDAIYAEALEHLRFTRRRLWAELRLAFPSTAGSPRFDKAADLTQAALTAAALIVGRPLGESEYPDGLASLRYEIVEIASIRGSKTFAEGIEKFFAGALPLAARKTALNSADEAAIDIRKALRKEVGITTCRNAMIEFFQQVDAAERERAAAAVVEQARREAERIDAERADAERREYDRLEAERRAREDAERQVREGAERRAREEAERKAREVAERQAREDAERRAREEAERRAREEAERRAREAAEQRAREEAERRAREEAERRAREEAERKAREAAERKAREEAERRAREEAERKAREEAERKAREAAERKAREEAERKAREEAERRAREEAERRAREEAERKAREIAERKAREEAERKAREEAERKEAERKAREIAERKAREEKARQDAERKAREEAERKAREIAERKAREEAERIERARLDAERKEREEADRKSRDEAERIERARLDAERRERERIEAERRERERAEQETSERIERARQEAERAERERIERERAERDRRDRERLEAERREAERKRLADERREHERAVLEARERERAEKEAREREERERAEHAIATSSTGWLVQPDKAAAFQPVAGEDHPAAPPPPAAGTYPIYTPSAETESWTPELVPPPKIEIAPVAAAPPQAPKIRIQNAPSGTGIRLRDDPEPLSPLPSRAEVRLEPQQLSAAGAYEPFSAPRDEPGLPWKLIAAGLVLVAGTFGIVKGSLPSQGTNPTPATQTEAPKALPPPPAPAAGSPTRVSVTTDPDGIRVLVDGKLAGTSPLTIDKISPGKHVLTLQGPGGTLRRTIRVEPGQTLVVDIPVFSGFAEIGAPFVVEVAENGKVLGTSEGQIILGPGRHTLHLQNRDLNYTATQAVDIEPGETARVTLDPRGSANINAAPWAEVFIDGQKAGDTPLANVPIRLGVREIVFKNPQFPERKIVTTIKSGTPATISVDFNKDK
jgi:PEGA domain